MFTPERTRLRHRIDRGDRLGAAWLSLGSPALVEMAARAGPDVIVLDLQHGLFDRGTLEAAIGMCPPEVPVLARVAENTPRAIGEALDAGAAGVVVPLVETGAQARRAVEAARFPPHGSRSGGGARPLADFPAYVEAAEGGVVVVVMIETARGVRNARAIAKTPGVDLVFVGTGDLSLSLGVFPAGGPAFDVALSEVRAACRAAWTPAGLFTTSLDAARARAADDWRLVVVANDIDLVGRGFRAAVQGFAAGPGPQRPAVERGSARALVAEGEG